MRRTLALGALAAAVTLVVGTDVYAQRGPQIILYQEDNFRGNQYPVQGPTEKLRFDDRASSVRVVSGSWQLCEDDNFRGRCVTVDQDVPKLSRLGMDDKISSLRPLENRRNDRRDQNNRDDRFGRRP
jgi:hypothetical protein